jgi:hypothetical protein
MAAEVVDRLAFLVGVHRFPSMGVAYSCSFRYDNYVRMQHFVRRSTYVRFRCSWGDVRRELCTVFLRLFMVLWIPIFATLCKRAFHCLFL